MNKYIYLIISITVLFGISVFADYDRDDDDRDNYRSDYRKSKAKSSVKNKLYLSECGSCHLAYQPELLPERSWIKLMNGLDNHFDEDAVLDKQDHEAILNYLKANAGDKKYVSDKHIRKFIRSIGSNNSPIRISDIPYFKKEHDEIPAKFIKQKEVKSLSHCQKCHQKAESGSYRERDILIPNYGRWDD